MIDERDEYLLSRYGDGDLSADERARVEAILAESPEAREMLRQYRQVGGLLRLAREVPNIDFDALREGILDRLDGGATADSPDPADLLAPGAPAPGSRVPAALRRSRAHARTDNPADHEAEDLREPTQPRRRFFGLSISTTYRGEGYKDAEYSEVIPLWRSPYGRVAVAACLLLAFGLTWQLARPLATHTNPGLAGSNQNTLATSTLQVSGPHDVVARAATGTLFVTGPSAERAPAAAKVDVSIGPSPFASGESSYRFYNSESRRGPTRVAIQPDLTPTRREDGSLPY